jgi:Tol biopolymer transport system component
MLVALKVLHPELAFNESYVSRWRRETERAKSLASPYIVKVLDSGRYGEEHVVAMEYVEGQSLMQRLMSGPPIETAQAIDVGKQVGLALDEAHSHAIIHGDISAQNILINDAGVVKVSDFGIPRGGVEPTASAPTFLGRPQYASPEHWAGGADVRSDLYSLGVVMYEMLSGMPLFNGSLPTATIQPRALREIRPDLSPALEAVVMRCLQKQPAARFSTPGEFLAALAAASPGSPQLLSGPDGEGQRVWKAREKSRSRGRLAQRRVLLGATCFILTLAAALVAAVVQLNMSDDQNRQSFLAFALDDYTTHTIHTFSPGEKGTRLVGQGVSILPPRGLMDATIPVPFQVSPTGTYMAYLERKERTFSLFLAKTEGLTRTLLAEGYASYGWSPDGTWLAYQVPWQGKVGLFVVEPERPEPVLIHSYDRAGYFAWSPDSLLLAYSAYSGNRSRLLVTGLNAPSPRVLVESSEELQVESWSPKSDRIAYSTNSQKGFKIVSVNERSEPVTLDTGISYANYFSSPGFRSSVNHDLWSVTGNLLAFRAIGSNTSALYLARSDGTGQVLLDAGESIDFTWSPTDDSLVIQTRKQSGVSLSIYSSDQVAPLKLAADLGRDRSNSIEWAPDGRRFAVSINESRSGGTMNELRVYLSDGSLESTLRAGIGYLSEVAWSSDGKWLAYSIHESTKRPLFVMHIESRTSLELSPNVNYFSWSKDSRLIAFLSREGETSTLYVAEPDGTPVRLGAATWVQMDWSGD